MNFGRFFDAFFVIRPHLSTRKPACFQLFRHIYRYVQLRDSMPERTHATEALGSRQTISCATFYETDNHG